MCTIDKGCRLTRGHDKHGEGTPTLFKYCGIGSDVRCGVLGSMDDTHGFKLCYMITMIRSLEDLVV